MVIDRGAEWCRITFTDKPDREILAALRSARFQWGAGSWVGPIADIPAAVLAKEGI
jgi:hypothetical protein